MHAAAVAFNGEEQESEGERREKDQKYTVSVKRKVQELQCQESFLLLTLTDTYPES